MSDPEPTQPTEPIERTDLPRSSGSSVPSVPSGSSVPSGPSSGPRKVLFVTQSTEGGAAFSLLHLASGLDPARYEPVVLFHRKGHPHIVERLAHRGIRTIFLIGDGAPPSPSGSRASGAERAASGRRRTLSRWLEDRFGGAVSRSYLTLKEAWRFARRQLPSVAPIVRAIEENRIDLVHVNDGLPWGRAGIVAARRCGRPCVCHVRMFHGLSGVDRTVGRSVRTFIYISRAVRDRYVDQGIAESRGRVIHNAVDLAEYDGIAADPKVREELGLGPGDRLVGIVGRLDWWKGHDHFIEAMARVVREAPLARGLIVGQVETSPRSRAYFEKLRADVRSLGLEGNVLFTGFRADVPRILAALDVVVLSSSSPEPFGRVVIEAMAAGKPVVATAAGGVLDIIEDASNGLLVPPRDSGAMAGAIRRLLGDPALAARIAEAGRRSVAERFSLPRHAEAVQAIYDEALAR